MFLGKEATGFNQQSEIWHGASFGTLIKIQEEPFEGPCEDHVLAIKGWTMCGTCFGHKRAMFWP